MDPTKTTSRPESFTIDELSQFARSGRLRVPEFQRDFRWGNRDVVALFDSINRGYPIGSALLWRRDAPQRTVTLGALTYDASAQSGALWVVDGQQRITSVINAIDPDVGYDDRRFGVVYSPALKKFGRPGEFQAETVIPLPDLFDIPRLLDWLQRNPDAQEFAHDLQNVTSTLRRFALPASVIDSGDEHELREIFDRINNSGRRLSASEVFDAIHRSTSDGKSVASVPGIADRLAATTSFGRINDEAIYQAILVRRHPDVSRGPHNEFDRERRLVSEFPDESEVESYSAAESALHLAIDFLLGEVGVPHVTFLPQRFLLLVLTRFFAHFTNPSPRSKHLLGCWFWRAASRAQSLGLSGSTSTVRALAGQIQSGDEHGSVQRLLRAVDLQKEGVGPDLSRFRTNQAASKLVLCALWSRGPLSLRTGEPIGYAALAGSLGDADTPADISREIVTRSRLDIATRLSAGNRMILLPDDADPMDWFEEILDTDQHAATLDSHLLTMTDVIEFRSRPTQAVGVRANALRSFVDNFLAVRTGAGFEDTPSLESLDLDSLYA